MKPARFPYAFIITYGRSGSTLLQGILNAIPGYLIRGENAGVLNHIEHLVNATTQVQREFSSIARTPADPWYGIDLIDRGQLLDDLRDVIVRQYLRPVSTTRCVGFKEVRYGPDRAPDLATFLDFMAEMFPGACFIFNEREPNDAARSGFWRGNPNAAEYLADFRRRMRTAYDRGNPNYHWVKYEEYVADLASLSGLFEFLNEPFDVDALVAVTAVTHSTRSQSPFHPTM